MPFNLLRRLIMVPRIVVPATEDEFVIIQYTAPFAPFPKPGGMSITLLKPPLALTNPQLVFNVRASPLIAAPSFGIRLNQQTANISPRVVVTDLCSSLGQTINYEINKDIWNAAWIDGQDYTISFLVGSGQFNANGCSNSTYMDVDLSFTAFIAGGLTGDPSYCALQSYHRTVAEGQNIKGNQIQGDPDFLKGELRYDRHLNGLVAYMENRRKVILGGAYVQRAIDQQGNDVSFLSFQAHGEAGGCIITWNSDRLCTPV